MTVTETKDACRLVERREAVMALLGYLNEHILAELVLGDDCILAIRLPGPSARNLLIEELMRVSKLLEDLGVTFSER